MPRGNPDRTYYLYRIQLRQEPSKDYVGITYDYVRRWRDHKKDARKGKGFLIARAIAKYGEDAFDWKLLAICRNSRIACDLEKICRHQLGMGYYNLTGGGEGAFELDPVTQEAKGKKIRDLWKQPEFREKTIKGMNAFNATDYGKKVRKEAGKPKSENLKKHQSELMLKLWQTEEYRDKTLPNSVKAKKQMVITQEFRTKMSKLKKGTTRTPEHIENWRKSFFANKEKGLHTNTQEISVSKSETQRTVTLTKEKGTEHE